MNNLLFLADSPLNINKCTQVLVNNLLKNGMGGLLIHIFTVMAIYSLESGMSYTQKRTVPKVH
ncbi:hypothetical protein COI44_12210 [Bacillus sp. AFS088145]|nr:hypothetical protein COI44_12210 [Bacillus sp. AFS088145]